MNKRTYRNTQTLLVFITLLVLGFSFYVQYLKGLEPCPLCLMQRFCVFLLLLLFLVGITLSTLKRGRLVAVFQMLTAAGGLFFAGRQLWLQALPAEHAPACMPGLDVLIHYFPWQDVAHALFWGAGDCAEVTWRWLGLSMPAWAAVYFLAVFITSALVFWRLGREIKEI